MNPSKLHSEIHIFQSFTLKRASGRNISSASSNLGSTLERQVLPHPMVLSSPQVGKVSSGCKCRRWWSRNLKNVGSKLMVRMIQNAGSVCELQPFLHVDPLSSLGCPWSGADCIRSGKRFTVARPRPKLATGTLPAVSVLVPALCFLLFRS